MTRALLRSVTPKVEGTEPREGGTLRGSAVQEANLHKQSPGGPAEGILVCGRRCGPATCEPNAAAPNFTPSPGRDQEEVLRNPRRPFVA